MTYNLNFKYTIMLYYFFLFSQSILYQYCTKYLNTNYIIFAQVYCNHIELALRGLID